MSSFTAQDWIARFIDELVVVIGALGEGSAVSGELPAPPNDGWVITLEGGHGATGLLYAQFDRTGIEAFTRKIAGDLEPLDSAVVDTLKEICAQAAGGVVQQAPCSGTTLSVIDAAPAPGPAPGSPVILSIAGEGVDQIGVALWGTIELVPDTADEGHADSPTHGPKLDVILDIDLPLMVRFGRTELPLKILTSLAPGSVIDLGRSPDDPVEVLVSNQIVARGEVVIVGGNYGVRIIDVISPAERVRTMEADFR